ncbi:MAG: AMP-binding protein [Dehalococcoidia bacterium]|nr:AMP-binding protein [Dehalococcoidia bacterium]
MLRRMNAKQLQALCDDWKERMPPAEREEWLGARLAKQVNYAYRHAPAVKRIFDAAGVSPRQIRSIRDLESLPVTTKDDLVKLQHAEPPFGGFLAVPLNSLSRIYVSPGPIYDAWGEERIRAAVRGFVRMGLPKPGDVVMVSTAYHMVPAGLFMTDALDVLGCTVVPAGIGQTELQVKLLHDLRATAICSFPSFTMSILKKAEEMGYNVRRDFNLKYTTGGGERHIQVLRKIFEEQYGLVVADGYATADVGSVAWDCGLGLGYHYDDAECVIEIVDPQTGRQVKPGEVGEIVVTLFSKVYPLVRFGTGDLATYTNETCPCGRTAPRIPKIIGMIGEHIRVKGMFVHMKELDDAFAKLPEVLKYQLVLKLEGHKDQITLNVETESDVDRKALAQRINQRTQEVFKLRMDAIEFLPKGQLPQDYKKVVDTRWA